MESTKLLIWDNNLLFIFFTFIVIYSVLSALQIISNLPKKIWDYICDKISNFLQRLFDEKIDNDKEIDNDQELENIDNKEENENNNSINQKLIINKEKKEENEEENKKGNQDQLIYFNFSDNVKYIFTLFGRLLITIYSFNGLFFLYNFIFQNLSLVATLFYYYENIFCQLVSSIFYIIFAILTSDVIVIPTYELISNSVSFLIKGVSSFNFTHFKTFFSSLLRNYQYQISKTFINIFLCDIFFIMPNFNNPIIAFVL